MQIVRTRNFWQYCHFFRTKRHVQLLLSIISAFITSMIVKQPQRNSIYLAIYYKAITFAIAMHLGQAMTVMVLFLISVR